MLSWGGFSYNTIQSCVELLRGPRLKKTERNRVGGLVEWADRFVMLRKVRGTNAEEKRHPEEAILCMLNSAPSPQVFTQPLVRLKSLRHWWDTRVHEADERGNRGYVLARCAVRSHNEKQQKTRKREYRRGGGGGDNKNQCDRLRIFTSFKEKWKSKSM